MLNAIPQQMNLMARNVTLRHPNSLDCEIYRKVVLRTGPDDPGGMPSLGGMAVLDSEDEPDVTWEDLGLAKLLNTEPFHMSEVVNRDDGLDMNIPEMFAQVEFLDISNDPDRRVLQKHDIAMLIISDDVRIGYEVMDVFGTVNIAPFTRKYRFEKRDVLNYIGDFSD
jgi:hypothetical protein